MEEDPSTNDEKDGNLAPLERKLGVSGIPWALETIRALFEWYWGNLRRFEEEGQMAWLAADSSEDTWHREGWSQPQGSTSDRQYNPDTIRLHKKSERPPHRLANDPKSDARLSTSCNSPSRLDALFETTLNSTQNSSLGNSPGIHGSGAPMESGGGNVAALEAHDAGNPREQEMSLLDEAACMVSTE